MNLLSKQRSGVSRGQEGCLCQQARHGQQGGWRPVTGGLRRVRVHTMTKGASCLSAPDMLAKWEHGSGVGKISWIFFFCKRSRKDKIIYEMWADQPNQLHLLPGWSPWPTHLQLLMDVSEGTLWDHKMIRSYLTWLFFTCSGFKKKKKKCIVLL